MEIIEQFNRSVRAYTLIIHLVLPPDLVYLYTISSSGVINLVPLIPFCPIWPISVGPIVFIFIEHNTNLHILVKMRGQPTSYDQSFWRYRFGPTYPILSHLAHFGGSYCFYFY